MHEGSQTRILYVYTHISISSFKFLRHPQAWSIRFMLNAKLCFVCTIWIVNQGELNNKTWENYNSYSNWCFEKVAAEWSRPKTETLFCGRSQRYLVRQKTDQIVMLTFSVRKHTRTGKIRIFVFSSNCSSRHRQLRILVFFPAIHLLVDTNSPQKQLTFLYAYA